MTAHQRLGLDISWRADIHPCRYHPDDNGLASRGLPDLEPADASSGIWCCDWPGSWGPLSYKTVTDQGELPFTREPGAVGFTATTEIDPDDHTTSHLDAEITFDEENTCGVETSAPGVSPYRSDYSIFVLLPSLLDEFNPDFPVTEPLKLDDQWMLVGANRDLNHDGMWLCLKWEDTTPEHAPDDRSRRPSPPVEPELRPPTGRHF